MGRRRWLVRGGAVLVGLTALEVGVRLAAQPLFGVSPTPAFIAADDALGWGLRAGAKTRHVTPRFDVGVSIDSHGFRGADWGSAGQEGSERPCVLVVGDSFVFGWGVEHVESVGPQLDIALPSMDVIAAGVPGYATDQERLLIEEIRGTRRVDHVVLVYTGNDAVEIMGGRAHGRAKPQYVVAEGGGAPVLHPPKRRAPDWFDRSAAWRLGWRLFDDARAKKRGYSQENQWQLTRELFHGIHADLDGVPLTVASHEPAIASLMAELDHADHVGLDEIIRPLGRAAFVPGDPHWSATGHAAVAAALAAGLSRELSALPSTNPLQEEAMDVWGDLPDRLVGLMREGIGVHEPNTSFFEGTALAAPFNGSYDWHSCVIAHWALLVHARVHGDEELRDWTLARLPIETLEAQYAGVEAFIKSDSDKPEAETKTEPRRGTYPYDEGWFCILLAEVEKHRAGDAQRVRSLRTRLESRLLATLESRPFPENIGLGRLSKKKGKERYCGFYGSTLFLYLQLRWSSPITSDANQRLDAWASDFLEPKREAIGKIEKGHGYDFLWVPALLALADDCVAGDAEPAPYTPPEFTDWPESVIIATVHVLGMELSRVWPCAADAASDDDAERVYRKRVSSLLAREDLWAEDFPACSHWVPQYLFIGEWLRAGRP